MQTAEVRAQWPTRQQAWKQLKMNAPLGLTPLEAAMKFGNYKWTTYMSDLFNAGYPIIKQSIKLPNNKRTMRYTIGEEA